MTLSLSKVKDEYFQRLFKSSDVKGIGQNQLNNETSTKRPKVLLLDNYTTTVISTCYSQSQLLASDIVLIELIDSSKDLSTMKHLDCIVYIKPCSESFQSLLAELRSPHYRKYELYFNNTTSKIQIEQLAQADEHEVVDKVVELFQDYSTLNDDLFLINPSTQAVNPILQEAESLASLLLSLNKTPLIKFETNSIELKRLGSEILYNINSNSNNNLFDDLNRNSDAPPILLLLDRKNDPITPLLSPWTYRSMINEFLKIDKNVVNLNGSQVVLSEEDQFYSEAMYLNYGDLTEKFKQYVEKYKSETKQSSIDNLTSQNLAELKKVITKFPEYKKFSVNVSTHLSLISAIDAQITQNSLWEIGELEQTIIAELDQQSNIKPKILQILESRKASTANKIKLILLYSYKFHNPTDLSVFITKLNNPELTSPLPTLNQLELLKKFATLYDTSNIQAGQSQQQQSQGLSNIFANKKVNIQNIFNRNTGVTNDNIFMQYTPRLNGVLANLIDPENNSSNNNQASRNSLSTLTPDRVKQQYGTTATTTSKYTARDIIVYIKGGATYEEARLVHELSQNNKHLNIIIGGDAMLNSSQWLNIMCDTVARNEHEDHDNDDDAKAQTRGTAAGQNRQEMLRDIL
ncbi:uncharacterized protein LODBEIA_P40920 [Lodderomyces beijingensis]|uniref:Vacuolar protein sorting-associated protein 45 n=1 Tax=Lodderomyces beijingensis TaxID=1775926 RepID=A0ABP0ZNY2_9ASCO